MACDILGGSGALVRVGKANLEDVVLILNDVDRGSGRSQEEHTVRVSLGACGFTGLGSGGTEDHLGTGVQRGVVSVDDFFNVVLVVLIDQFDFVFPLGVDLVHGDLGTVLGGQAVQGGGTGRRSDMGDLQGDGLVSESGAHGQCQRQGKSQSDKLFHSCFLLKY